MPETTFEPGTVIKHRYVDPAEVEFVRRRLNTEIGEARYGA